VKTYRSPRDLLADVEAVLRQPHRIKNSPHFAATYSPAGSPHTAVVERVARLLYEGRHHGWVAIDLDTSNGPVRLASCGPAPAAGADKRRSNDREQFAVFIKIATRSLGKIMVRAADGEQLNATDRMLLIEITERTARFLTGPGHYILWRTREQLANSRIKPQVQPSRITSARAAGDSR
jgi:hypothetical protein